MEDELCPYLFSGYLNLSLYHFDIFRLGHLLSGDIWSILCPYIVCRIGISRRVCTWPLITGSGCEYSSYDGQWQKKIYCRVLLHQWMIHGITRQWIKTQWVLTRPDSNMSWANDRTTVPTLGQLWANLHCCFVKSASLCHWTRYLY